MERSEGRCKKDYFVETEQDLGALGSPVTSIHFSTCITLVTYLIILMPLYCDV